MVGFLVDPDPGPCYVLGMEQGAHHMDDFDLEVQCEEVYNGEWALWEEYLATLGQED